MNEHVATYYYDMENDNGTFDIYACYDSVEDYDKRKVSFYDVYDKDGTCVNEGNPYYSFPTWDSIYQNYYSDLP